MADGKIQIQSTDNRIYTVTPEVGAGGNVALTLPKEGGMLTVDAEVVHKTGDETIAGVKTFTSSPIVPTPTTDMQVATKLYVDTNSGISLATANSYDLGVGQTWQDVTASRATGTTYTNSTGKPISISLWVTGTVGGYYTLAININSIRTYYNNDYANASGYIIGATIIIPYGATYSVSGDNTALTKWWELR